MQNTVHVCELSCCIHNFFLRSFSEIPCIVSIVWVNVDYSLIQMSIDDVGNITLVITEAFPKDDGLYALKASNAAGEAFTSANVSVKGIIPCETSDSEVPSDIEPVRPSVENKLKDIVVEEGKEALLECIIVGVPEPEVNIRPFVYK